MSTITLPNIRVSSDLTVKVRLKDGGVAIDWSTLSGIRALIYSDAQKAMAGRCVVTVDAEDNTLLVCQYAANKPQYIGVNRIVISATYLGEMKTYDKPALNFVRWTDDQAGEEITISDPDVEVEIEVEDVSSSILQEAVNAAFSAAERADEAAAAAEHMVDIHQGPEGPAGADGADGKSAYEIAVEEGFEGTEAEWLESLVGPQGPQGIQGIQGIQGEQGPQGEQGNPGSSVDYPFELVNNEETNDATKAHTAAGAKRLNDKIGQLEAEVDEVDGLRVSTSPVDLSFEDGDGNVLVKFSDGHIEVENFDSRDVADISTDITDEADLEFSDPDGNAIVRFIDGHIKTKNFDSSDVSNKKPYARETYFKTKVDCVQMNASSFDSTNPNAYVSQVLYQDNCVLLLPDSYTPGGKPTRLIIFCKQGNNQITDSSNPILTSNAMGNIFHFLLARGYAVLGADGVPDGLSTALGLDDTRVSGSYAAVQSTREAYDYVIENYNIDKTGAFIFGYSQGGIYAQNVIDLSGIPFLGCAMVSPTVSMRFHLWDLSSTKEIGGVTWTKTSRLNIARLYGFDEVETDAELLALQFNREKVAGYDPWNRNVENPYEGFTQTSAYGSNLWALPSGTSIDTITMKKKIGCPTKIWAAVNDSTLGTDVTKVFVKACRNAGQVCDLHLYNDGNHHIFQSTYQSPAISTFTDQGNSYNLYPITYEIASFFYRCGGLSLTD